MASTLQPDLVRWVAEIALAGTLMACAGAPVEVQPVATTMVTEAPSTVVVSTPDDIDVIQSQPRFRSSDAGGVPGYWGFRVHTHVPQPE